MSTYCIKPFMDINRHLGPSLIVLLLNNFHIGFQASSVDCNLFILHHGTFVVYLLLYVDDIIITGNSLPFINHLVSRLSAAFFFFFERSWSSYLLSWASN